MDRISDVSARVFKALSYIDEHLGEDLPLDDLAAVSCYSKYHFLRVFSDVVGVTPAEYILNRRLEQSAHQLVTDQSLSIESIAASAGFSSASNFSRVFKKSFSCTPHEARGDPGLLFPIPRGLVDFSRVTVTRMPETIVLYERSCSYLDDSAAADAMFARLRDQAAYLGVESREPRFGTLVRNIPGLLRKSPVVCDYCVSVSADHESVGSERFAAIPSGSYAVYVHRGDPNLAILPKIWYELIWAWLPTTGFRAAKWFGYTRLVTREPYAVELCLPLAP